MTLCCDLEGRAAVVHAEVRVSGADDTDQMAPVLFDIEELDDLFGNSPAIATGPIVGVTRTNGSSTRSVGSLVNVGNRTAG